MDLIPFQAVNSYDQELAFSIYAVFHASNYCSLVQVSLTDSIRPGLFKATSENFFEVSKSYF